MRRAIGALMAASLLGLWFLPLLDHLAWRGAGVAGVAFVLVYFVARYWGTLLPYLAEFGVAADGPGFGPHPRDGGRGEMAPLARD